MVHSYSCVRVRVRVKVRVRVRAVSAVHENVRQSFVPHFAPA